MAAQIKFYPVDDPFTYIYPGKPLASTIPSAPTQLEGIGESDSPSYVNLYWTPSTSQDVVEYVIYKNGIEIGTINAT